MLRSVTGPTGSVRWGYRTVATLSQWTFTPAEGGGTLTATMTHGDVFGLEQSPLIVQVPVGASMWKCPVRTWQRDGSTVTFQVGPVE